VLAATAAVDNIADGLRSKEIDSMKWVQSHIAELAMSAAMAWGKERGGDSRKRIEKAEGAPSETTQQPRAQGE
jgi:hypothetical protein